MTCCGTTATWAATEARLPSEGCPAWGLVDTATMDNPVLANGAVTLRTRANAENLAYRMTAPAVQAGNLVSLRFRMQFVSDSANAPWRTGAGVAFSFGPTRTKNTLYIDDGEIFLLSAENTRGASATVATADAMHDYVVEVNRGTGAVSVLRDGSQVLTGSLFITATDTTTDTILFGDISLEATGESRWASFEHTAWAGCGAAVEWAATENVLPTNDCPTWALTDTAATDNPVLAASSVTLQTRANAENLFYAMSPPAIAAGAQVQLRFRAQLVSSSAAQAPWRTGAGVNFAFGQQRRKNSLYLGSGEIFLLSAENTRGPAATVNTSGFHDYVVNVNTGTGAVQVLYDGVPTLTGSLFITATDTTTDYVYWGDVSSFAFGQSVWASFAHDAYLFCAP
ncbi:MAG: hypothetical protein Q8S33_30940 [Myxococcales bacterium]|nr:hypothetical protein [Myxococcales bacterium]